MTGSPEQWRELAVPCADPDCLDAHGSRNLAEPEGDGEHRWHECPVCGYAFGWHRATPTLAAAAVGGSGAKSDGVCAVGVPEGLRRAASAAMNRNLNHSTDRSTDRSTPLLQIGRRADDDRPA